VARSEAQRLLVLEDLREKRYCSVVGFFALRGSQMRRVEQGADVGGSQVPGAQRLGKRSGGQACGTLR